MQCGCVCPLSLTGGPGREGSAAGSLDRRHALRGLATTLAVALAGCGPPISAAHREAAQDVAVANASVDLHSHPGLFSSSRRSIDDQAARMAQGKLKASLFAAVADGPLIQTRPGGGLYTSREPAPGELYTYTWRQLGRVTARIDAGRLVLIRTPQELEMSGRQGVPGAILAVEGGDFIEGRLDRIAEAHARGVRSIQLVHYRINELGDIQTEPPRHGGLTPFGQDVIREMNRLGMVVDVAHLTHAGVRSAAAVTKKPLLLSHTVVGVPWARAVSVEHAQLIAKGGGVVGVFPVNIGYLGFSGYIDHISRMIEAVGVDHVGVGTDMDGIAPASFASFDDYAEWPSIGAALLARGRSRDDVAKLLGGNFRRVFTEAAG